MGRDGERGDCRGGGGGGGGGGREQIKTEKLIPHLAYHAHCHTRN